MNELGKEARDLLASLRDADGPSLAQTSRMKQKLGLALAAGGSVLVAGGAAGAAKLGAAGTAGAAGVASGAKLGGAGIGGLLSMFVLGAAAGVGVSTTTAVVRNYTAAPAASVVASERVPADRSPRTPSEPAPGAVAIDAGEYPPGEDRAPVPTQAFPAPAPVADVPAPSAGPALEATLGPELELVISAKRELAQGRPAQALAVVERLAREFPNGALREERMLLRVLALCALGQVEPARRQAREFAEIAPRSPLLPRLEQSCGIGENQVPRTTR